MVVNNIFVESVIKVTDSTKTFIRIFDSRVNTELLTWHQDEKERAVKVVNDCKGWAFQFDDSTPKELYKGHFFTITAEKFHRLIKGGDNPSDLILTIVEIL